MNEALTNAFKYAVPEVEAPRIRVHGGAADGYRYLHIRDNGPGFPDDTLRAGAGSFGLTFLHSIGGDGRWEVELQNADGAVVTFRF